MQYPIIILLQEMYILYHKTKKKSRVDVYRPMKI